jgi:hypothetical protein
MTKKEMRKSIDIVMLNTLNDALNSCEKGFTFCAGQSIAKARGIMHTASILELLTDEEFENINHTLAYTSMQFGE